MTWGTRIRTGPLGRRGAATADAPSLNETAAQLSTKVVRTPLEQANGAGGGGGRSHVLWVMATILLIAAFPRVWHLMSAGFRGDEAVYAGQAGILSGDGDLSRYFVLTSRGNSNFLLYQELVAMVYFFFGVSDVAARLVSVAFSLATVVVTFEFARTLYDRRVAYAAALGVAFSGYSVMLGRIALLDSTLTFLFTLSLLAFAKWLEDGIERVVPGLRGGRVAHDAGEGHRRAGAGDRAGSTSGVTRAVEAQAARFPARRARVHRVHDARLRAGDRQLGPVLPVPAATQPDG